MTFLLYLGKVFLGSAILLGYYWFFLRNKQFHRYNRFFLLGAFVLPVCLAFIRIGVLIEPANPVNQVVYRTINVLTVSNGEDEGMAAAAAPANDLFKIEYLLYIVYAAGVVALFILLLKSLLYINRIARTHKHEVVGDLKLYNTNEPGTPFSFLRSVFWNEQLEFNTRNGQQIFRHELFHVQQRHSLDVLLCEGITALFWWNPFFHIAKKELKAIHEFLADEFAASGNDRYTYAELLVLQTIQACNMQIPNQFFNNHIKRRIAMITRLSAAKNTYWSRLMALPIIIALFCCLAFYVRPHMNALKENERLHVIIDAGHGGIDNGAASPSGKLEKDLTLQISQQIQALAAEYNVEVTMTRSKDELPAHIDNVRDALLYRAALAEQIKADAFLSIHVSAAGDGASFNRTSGFEVFIPSKSEKFGEASRQLGAALQQSLAPFYKTSNVLKQRNEKGIWVLDRGTSAAALIECGYLTNKEDLDYISKTENQQAIARKLLEGLVAYKKQAGAVDLKPFSYAAPADTNVVTALARHFNQHTLYPQLALNNNTEGEVYFSMDIDTHAQASNFQLYDKAPQEAQKIWEIVTIGAQPYAIARQAAYTFPNCGKGIFKEEIRRVAEKPIHMNNITSTRSARYYFKAVFKKLSGC